MLIAAVVRILASAVAISKTDKLEVVVAINKINEYEAKACKTVK